MAGGGDDRDVGRKTACGSEGGGSLTGRCRSRRPWAPPRISRAPRATGEMAPEIDLPRVAGSLLLRRLPFPCSAVLAPGSPPRPGSSAPHAQISRAGSDGMLRPCPPGPSPVGSTPSPVGTLLFPGYAASRLRRSRGEGEREWGGACSEWWLGCSVPRDAHARGIAVFCSRRCDSRWSCYSAAHVCKMHAAPAGASPGDSLRAPDEQGTDRILSAPTAGIPRGCLKISI
jgi:hypothetical protein